MDLSGYQANIVDSHGYYVDALRRHPTLAEAQAEAEQRYEDKGWFISWRDNKRLWAHPEHESFTEFLRIYELDAKGNVID